MSRYLSSRWNVTNRRDLSSLHVKMTAATELNVNASLAEELERLFREYGTMVYRTASE